MADKALVYIHGKHSIKQAALDNDCSVSELVRRWLEKYWAEKEIHT